MHPMVKPALRRAWRERQIVQFGVTPAHAVAVGPMDTATGTLLQLFDGTRGLPLLRAEARAMGLPDGQTDALVNRLTKAGLLDDPTAGGRAADALRRKSGALDRLRPDLASLSVVHREPGGGIRQLAARHSMRVQVRGAGRVGATVAALLSAAGVGQVDVLDGGCAEPWDVAPGGLPATAVGERRDSAVRQVVHRCAPLRSPRAKARARPSVPDRALNSAGDPGTPDIHGGGTAETPAEATGGRGASSGEPGMSLIIVCPRDGLAAYAPDPDGAERWINSGTPHLYAGVVEATGVVGPLVLPGGSACAGCLERGRAERDPRWPRLLAQWRSGGRRAAVPACDISLATTVAGLTAAHALSFLDGDLPLSVGARWEVALPALSWRCEPIAPHRGCDCGAPRKSEGSDTSARSEVTRH